MMLSGEYVTLNSHWEDWNLPKWYHPDAGLNMTTIERLNDIAKLRLYIDDTIPKSSRRRNDAPHNGGSTAVDRPHMHSTLSDYSHHPTWTTTLQALPPTPPPSPRFPSTHPLFSELIKLQDSAAVIHFSAVGKPWSISPDIIWAQKPDAHPLLAQQFEKWRSTATRVCPKVASPEEQSLARRQQL